MNVTSLLQFESMKYVGAQTQASAINHHVAQALRVFIEEFYQRMAPAFIVILSCRRPSPMNFYRTIMQLLYESVDTMIIQLVLVEFAQPGQRRRIGGPRTHNLLLVDSLDALLDIEMHTYSAQSDGSEYYFIFLQQRDAQIPQDMQGVFAYCWRHQLLNCNVMTQSSGGQVVLHTYFPYQPDRCNDSIPRRINQFLGPSWQHGDYFPSKMSNLHGCPLVVLARNTLPFFQVQQQGKEKVELRGLEGRLLQELSRLMNFSIRLEDHSTSTEEQLLLELVGLLIFPISPQTQTQTQPPIANPFQKQEGRAHLAIGYVRKHIQYSRNLTPVFPHYSNRMVGCLLLNAHNLTSLEMWSFPFQALAWLCLLASFLSISGLFLFASWLCFGLIVRAMYSALLFLILRHHIHERLPESLRDLNQGGYSAVMTRSTWQDLREVPGLLGVLGLRSVVVTTGPEEVLQQLDRSVDSLTGLHPRIVGLLSQDTLLHLTQRGHRAGAYHIVTECILEQQLAIYLQKHSHLVIQLDHLVMSIRAVGLLHHWAGQLASERYFRSRFLLREKLIRLPDLWAVCLLASALYLCALIVFICEIVAARRGGNP
ncbi:hypothetical protein KR009_001531 [Drosophila setifemur]|nr:hypothetical protein KR009_001531 [Drosophila setifemur]